MPAAWSLTPPYFLLLGFLCGIAGFRVGWRAGNRIALPLIQGLFGWGVFVLSWVLLGPAWAAVTVLAWAFGTTLASVYVFLGRPAETDAKVLRAAAYRETMLAWLAAGRGPETEPVATLVQHARELVRYLAAAALTANLASIAMGAVLLNYMNAYVATLLRAAKTTWVVLLLAWNVWSLVRVAAYVVLGAALASPLLSLCGLRRGVGEARALAIVGGIGVAIDAGLKLALSRSCGRALARAVDLDAVAANRTSDAPLTLDLS